MSVHAQEAGSLRFVDGAYASSFDGTAPLRVLSAYRPDHQPKPLLVCIHSYDGDRRRMLGCITERAARGFVAVAPDMRGRADSAGRRDDGGLEIADIYDAVRYALRTLPEEIDPSNINISGWSGGGGSVYQATVKMPELFRSAQIFYGVSDYAYWARSSEHWMRHVGRHVGCTPDESPHRYLARNAVAAVGNNRCTRTRIFWDEEETLCPPQMNRMYLDRAAALGLSNITGHESRKGDRGRWHHGGEVHVEIAQAMYEPEIHAGTLPPPRLADRGELVVPGFLVTRRFTVCLGTGEDAVANVGYTWSPKAETLTLSEPRASPGCRAWVRFPIDERGVPDAVYVNDTRLHGVIEYAGDPHHVYLYDLGVEDRIRLAWR